MTGRESEAGVNPAELAGLSPGVIRSQIRSGQFAGPSRGLAPGFVQCNIIIVPAEAAFDLLLFCQRNLKACPVLEVSDPGDPVPHILAPGADIRTDLARFAVWRDGTRQANRTSIHDLWRDDLVTFYVGSGMTFDDALARAGVPTDQYRWVLRTATPARSAGRFSGNLIVTMRWLSPQDAIVATQVSSRFPHNHGAPVHIGEPSDIGADIASPLFGGEVPSRPDGLVPVFWACGVTPQAAMENAALPVAFAHAPAHSFITDLPADRLSVS